MGNRVAAGLIVAAAATLVVTAGPAGAGAMVVSTEAELRAAFDTESSIVLANDIELSDCIGGGAVTRSANAPVNLEGAGFTITQTCVDNIFEPDQSDVTLQNVTLTGGREPDDGGAIDMNGGNLTMIESALVGNCAADSAGAIENEDGDTTIIRSTLAGNDADDQGGAVRSKRGNTLIVNSTVTENTQAQLGAVDSGQMDAVDASLTLVYSTIVANANDASVDCDVGVLSEADTDTDGDVGAAQVNPANVNAVDTFASFGTVVALPSGGPNCDIGTPGSEGYNYADDGSCGFTDPTDVENGSDPLLGGLAANGGPTQTRLPQAGSPLIDAIPVANCADGDAFAGEAITTDQRNLPRPASDGRGCEIGSVELQPPLPPTVPPAEIPPPVPLAATARFTG
ncbi:MAG: choice-of-anchor Q domain-containing protein [Acidimicrobiia bacterium]